MRERALGILAAVLGVGVLVMLGFVLAEVPRLMRANSAETERSPLLVGLLVFMCLQATAFLLCAAYLLVANWRTTLRRRITVGLGATCGSALIVYALGSFTVTSSGLGEGAFALSLAAITWLLVTTVSRSSPSM